MNKVYYFISDIHLGLHQKDTEAEKEKALVDFLKTAQSNCDELFIRRNISLEKQRVIAVRCRNCKHLIYVNLTKIKNVRKLEFLRHKDEKIDVHRRRV